MADAAAVSDPLELRYLRRYPIVGLALLPLQLAMWRARGFSLLHLHWQRLNFRVRFPGHARASVLSYRFMYWYIGFLGFNVIWTVHNLVPHEPQTTDDWLVSRMLMARCSGIIAHTQETATRLSDMRVEASPPPIVIPIGNFEGYYPPADHPESVRHALGVPEGDLVLLAFGHVRPYKGLEDLVAALATVERTDVTLLVAGPCHDDSLRTFLGRSALEDPRVRLHLGRVPDAMVSSYFTAADVLCAPFRSITTTSSVLLGQTFSLPVIAPRLGSLSELPSNCGWLYDADDADGLRRTLHIALNSGQISQFGANARAQSLLTSWKTIGQETLTVYATAASEKRSRSRASRPT
ncbi:glycosyltransferase [Acidothermaceae bacterium B102]|nr:glycosyltransferase [Acidothermaceae bacterium B102]